MILLVNRVNLHFYPNKSPLIAMASTLEGMDINELNHLDDVFLVVYHWVDAPVKAVGGPSSRPGNASRMTDSEVIAIRIVGNLSGASECGWYRFVTKHFKRLFPSLVERGVYHKRCKNLLNFMIKIQNNLSKNLSLGDVHIIDGMPGSGLRLCPRRTLLTPGRGIKRRIRLA